jgi:hypothetical protein
VDQVLPPAPSKGRGAFEERLKGVGTIWGHSLSDGVAITKAKEKRKYAQTCQIRGEGFDCRGGHRVQCHSGVQQVQAKSVIHAEMV